LVLGGRGTVFKLTPCHDFLRAIRHLEAKWAQCPSDKIKTLRFCKSLTKLIISKQKPQTEDIAKNLIVPQSNPIAIAI
jgi:hypothetical protein